MYRTKRVSSSSLISFLSALIIFALVATAQVFAINYTDKPTGDSWWYAKGVLIIKFAEGVDKSGFDLSAGRSSTGLPEVDRVINANSVYQIDKLFRQSEATHKRGTSPLYNYYRINFDTTLALDEVAAEFNKLPEVEAVDKVGVHPITAIPNDPAFGSLWGLNQSGDNDIDGPEAWDEQPGDSVVLVGAMDSGVQWDHPDLAGPAPYTNGNVWINWAEYNGLAGVDDDGNGYVDDFRGWDWVNVFNFWPGEDGTVPDNDPMDFNGHGSHTAGTMAAMTNNGVGVSGVAGGWYGASHGCKIVPLRIGWSQESGGVERGFVRMDFAAQAFEYAGDMGVDVVNCSWGSSSSSALNSAVTYAVSQGVVVVTSAGNDNDQVASYLAARSDVISVASLTSSGVKSSFSSYGTWVDISAPGSGIYSTYSNHGSPSYANLSGTSMASPHVAGVAALIRSKLPDIRKSALDTILIQTTDYIYDKNPAYNGLLGTGRVNAAKALAATNLANPGADVRIGEAPLDVNFTSDSPVNLVALTYHFGDGDSLVGFSGMHQYTTPGAYTLQLDAQTSSSQQIVQFPQYIIAYADTLEFADFAGSPAAGVVSSVRFHNFAPVSKIDLPIKYPGSLNLLLDSVSVAGYRASIFDQVEIVSLDVSGKRAAIRISSSSGAVELPAGDGELLRLYFRFLTTPSVSAIHDLDVMPYETYAYALETPVAPYQPSVTPAKLDIRIGLRGDADLSGSVTIADAVTIINAIFGGGIVPPLYNGDADGNGSLTIADAVYLIQFIFGGGPPPPA